MIKNKLLFIVFVGLIAFIGLTGCAKREIANLGSKGTNIICFGDSITFGYGVNPGEDYPTALGKMVAVSVINCGIDGDTTVEALQRLDEDALQRDPLLVIIEFAGNDFLRKIPKETTINNVKEMIGRIQARKAMVAIVDISAGMFMAEYRGALKKLAAEENVIFVPSVLSGIITNPGMKSDFMHPNAAGYKIVAERIYRMIKPALEQNAALRKSKP